MNANTHYDSDGVVQSLVISRDRTKWYWDVTDSVATFRRVEVKKDDHSTETAVVLFGEEWFECKNYVRKLPFIDEIEVQRPIE